MTADAAGLSDFTRWLGVAIAFVGALLANPEATEHAALQARDWVVTRWGRARAWLARYLPRLRRHYQIDVNSGVVIASAPMARVTAEGHTSWAVAASTEDKLEFLLGQVHSLSKSLGEVRHELGETEGRLKAQMIEAVESLRGETEDVRQALNAFRKDVVRGDASALPIIVIGVILSGVAEDARRAQLWVWWLLLIGLTALAVRFAWAVVCEWRRRRAEVPSA